jgi:hypothetical protein
VKILYWAGVRAHFLLPHQLVATIGDDRCTAKGVTVERGVFSYQGDPFLRLLRRGPWPSSRVQLTALADVWLQEAGLTVKLEKEDGSEWQGFGYNNRWTSTPKPLHDRDAHFETVHFSRVRWLDPKKTRRNPKFTTGVEYRSLGAKDRFYGGEGFARMLDEPAGRVPWQGCSIFGTGLELAGTVRKSTDTPVRAWELSAHPASPWPNWPWPGSPGKPIVHPASDWMHFTGWGGGAGVVVQNCPPWASDHLRRRGDAANGRDPDMPIDHLWDPATWRLLRKGRTITQSVRAARL